MTLFFRPTVSGGAEEAMAKFFRASDAPNSVAARTMLRCSTVFSSVR